MKGLARRHPRRQRYPASNAAFVLPVKPGVAPHLAAGEGGPCGRRPQCLHPACPESVGCRSCCWWWVSFAAGSLDGAKIAMQADPIPLTSFYSSWRAEWAQIACPQPPYACTAVATPHAILMSTVPCAAHLSTALLHKVFLQHRLACTCCTPTSPPPTHPHAFARFCVPCHRGRGLPCACDPTSCCRPTAVPPQPGRRLALLRLRRG